MERAGVRNWTGKRKNLRDTWVPCLSLAASFLRVLAKLKHSEVKLKTDYPEQGWDETLFQSRLPRL